jgi:hypothetical protein
MCFHQACWEHVPWLRIDDDGVVIPTTDVPAARQRVRDEHQDRVVRQNRRSQEARDWRTIARPWGKYQNNWDDNKRAPNSSHGFRDHWASGGASRDVAQPYPRTPWTAFDVPVFVCDAFPPSFWEYYLAKMNDETLGTKPIIRSNELYNRSWSTICGIGCCRMSRSLPEQCETTSKP